MRKRIVKQLTQSLFLTFIFASFLSFLAINIGYAKEAKSLEGSQGVFIMVLVAIVWTFILTFCSLTVLLNLNDKVRRNTLYSSMTFFIVPLLAEVTVYVTNHSQGLDQEFLLMTLPFFLIQTISCIVFVRTNFEANPATGTGT